MKINGLIFYIFNQKFYCFSIIRPDLSHHKKEHYSKWPNIAFFIIISSNDLRSQIIRGAILTLQILARRILCGITKIDQFYYITIFILEHKIFRFYVSMHNFHRLVQIIYGLQNLKNHLDGKCLILRIFKHPSINFLSQRSST